MISGDKCIRIEVFQTMLKHSQNFPVRIPLVDELKMRLTEAVAQSTRIQRLFPEFWEFQISNKQRLADGKALDARATAGATASSWFAAAIMTTRSTMHAVF